MSYTSQPISNHNEEFYKWLDLLSAELQVANQRLVLSIEGDQAWCGELLLTVQSWQTDTLVISDRELGDRPVTFSRVDTLLGGESPVVVVDLFNGLNPDVLCIASGLVSCGGVLILLSPGPDNWGRVKDQFGIWQDNLVSSRPLFAEKLFKSIGRPSNGGIRLAQAQNLPPIPELPSAQPIPANP